MVARLTLVHFRWFVITDCPSEQIKRQVGGRKRTAVPIAPIAFGDHIKICDFVYTIKKVCFYDYIIENNFSSRGRGLNYIFNNIFII